MKNNKKKQGILFWITGLSGSGKTSIAENVKKKLVILVTIQVKKS